jgi:hypothetical protein
MIELTEVQAWFYDKEKKDITVANVNALEKLCKGRLEIVRMNDGNFSVFATNDLDKKRLENWMINQDPTPACHQVLPESL